MTDDSPKRCTHIATRHDGAKVECFAEGGWVLDKEARTWRPARPSDKARRCWAHGPGEVTRPIGHGGRRKVHPNAKLQRIAGLVLGASLEVTRALIDVNDELSMLGFPSSSSRGVSVLGDPVGDKILSQAEFNTLTSAMGSRAEKLFGIGTTISNSDVSKAIGNLRSWQS